MSQGNFFAYFVMAIFPLVANVLFRKLSIYQAVICTIVIGYLFLPVRTWFDPPIGPHIDKYTLSSLVALFFACLYSRKRPEILPQSSALKFLLILFVVSPVFTGFLNQNPLVYGYRTLPGIDMLSGAGISALALQFFVIVPFIAGRQYVNSEESLTAFLKILSIAGIAYTLVVLWEVRMSPRLHSQIYGYFPHVFAQQIRQDGFRSAAFIGHGLRTSMFLLVAFTATLFLAKQKITLFGIKASHLAIYLFVVIILNKSLAVAVYATAATMFTLFLSDRARRTSLILVCMLVVVYPVVRGSVFFPEEGLINLSLMHSAERAESLEFRFKNENALLEKAQQKPIFGWGGYGRNRIFNERGDDISVTDGDWILSLGISGWVGFLAKYCLLVLPIFMSIKASIVYGSYQKETIFLSCILSLVLANTLVNSEIAPWAWLICGSLVGFSERVRTEAQKLRYAEKV